MPDAVTRKGSARGEGMGQGRFSKTSGCLSAAPCIVAGPGARNSFRPVGLARGGMNSALRSEVRRISRHSLPKSHQTRKFQPQTPPSCNLEQFSRALRQFSPASDPISFKLEAFSLTAEAFRFVSFAFGFVSKRFCLHLDAFRPFFHRFHHHSPFTNHHQPLTSHDLRPFQLPWHD